MTPQEIADYKQQWMSKSGYAVQVHSDYQSYGKDWCKQFLGAHQYVLRPYTDVYEDTWFFESQVDADNFALYIKAYSNRP
jgi:hypothetical protein